MNDQNTCQLDKQPTRIGAILGPVQDAMRTRRQSNPLRQVSATESRVPSRCAHCGGAGYLRYDVDIEHPLFGQIVPCQCREAVIRERQLQRLTWLSGLRPAMQRMTFDAYQAESPAAGSALEAARAFATDPNGWLYLQGPYGTGKTHLLAAIAWELVARDVETLYIVVPDLLLKLRETFDAAASESLAERLERIRQADVLLLDDLGAEKSSAWASEQLFSIVNDRYLSERSLVVSSNLPPAEIGGRLGSRLGDRHLVTHVALNGTDYRSGART